MGGGPIEPAEEDYKALVKSILQACEGSLSSSPESSRELEDDYRKVDDLLKERQHFGGILAKCAANVEIMEQLRQLARRYMSVEVTSGQVVVSCLDLVDELMDSLVPLEGALRTNASGARGAVQVASNRLSQLGTLMTAAAATHRAVAMELDTLVVRTGQIARSPSEADAGLKAAPFLGGAAGTALVMLLRAAGPVGVLGAMGLVAGAALGGSTAAAALSPQIRRLFDRLEDEVGQVANQVHRQVAAMEALSWGLAGVAGQLASTLDIVPDGSDISCQLYEEALSACNTSLEAAALRCASCRYRSSPFFAISSRETALEKAG